MYPMSPPPLSYKIFTDVVWLTLLAGVLMMLGLAFRIRFVYAAAGIGSILFGIIGGYLIFYTSQVETSDFLLFMGIIPVFGLIMGITSIIKRADHRSLSFTGTGICIVVLVMDIIFLITYPVFNVWIILATVVILVGVIIYGFIKVSSNRRINSPPNKQ